jgi:hypothetical protein
MASSVDFPQPEGPEIEVNALQSVSLHFVGDEYLTHAIESN